MLELQRDRTQIAAILEQLRESAPPLAAANGNSFNVADPVALGEADIDQARLYQCLMQLVGNAAKFTRHGHIQVAALRRAGQLVFEVSDTGIGIAEVDRQRIFEPFVQIEADPARRYEGAGLGLAFVQRLARLMGGEVTCDSAPGRGSVFRLSIAAA